MSIFAFFAIVIVRSDVVVVVAAAAVVGFFAFVWTVLFQLFVLCL